MSLNTEVTQSLRWFVACPQYVEPLLADELIALGGQETTIGHSGVHTQGDLGLGYRIALWSRLASRLTLQLAEGAVESQSALQALLHTVAWERHLEPQGTLRVRFFGRTDEFRNTQFGAQWVKDQLADYYHDRYGERPSVSREPDLTIVVNLHKQRATIGIELNQDSLHHRDYRPPSAKAPLRENLAAAVLIRAGWPQLLADTDTTCALIDPMCGSGTLLLEGALMAADWAPGLLRQNTLAQHWLGHDTALWQTLLAEAEERKMAGLQTLERIEFWGNDASDTVFAQARQAWRRLGLPEARWTQSDVARMPAPVEADHGLVVVNPPYGERLSSTSEIPALYRSLGTWMSTLPAHFKAAILLPDSAAVVDTRLFFDKSYRLLNADIECRLYTFRSLHPRAVKEIVPVEDLANRLRKNLRKLKPFIKQGTTDAYRIYDADLPEYAIAVDRYGDWLHVQEYAPPKTIPEHTAQQRLDQALVTLSEVLGVPVERIALKQRTRQKGTSQYERQDNAEQTLVVYEHGVKAKVNLLDYLDTGLFLDHRPMRYWIQRNAKGKRVLNLFCYTGMVSVHAAAGGARRVDSVDLSATYLNWAQDNFRLNQLSINAHGFMRADVMSWLADTQEQYDLIFVDPPTFSNSKRMDDTFDVQRDQVALIDGAMRCLSPGGTLVFSNNYRRFKLAPELTERYHIEDKHAESLPPDFARNPRIHGCWFIRRA